MRIFILLFLSIIFFDIQAQDPSYIKARFKNFDLNETVDPLPQIIIDFDIFYFEQAFPNLGLPTDSLRLDYFISPTNKDDLDSLKIVLEETDYFISIEIINDVLHATSDLYDDLIDIKLSPNPVSDVLNISVHHEESFKDERIIISNNLGQQLGYYPIEQSNLMMMIDVGSFASGTYFLTYLVKGQVLKTERFIKD